MSPSTEGSAAVGAAPPARGRRCRRPSGRKADDEGRGAGAKSPWRPHEDAKLAELVGRHGPQNWNLIAAELDGRSSKNCRLRWCNQLDPSLSKTSFSAWEDAVVFRGLEAHGSKWARIAKLLPGRTDNAVKNRWNCTLKRRDELGILSNDWIASGKTLESLLAERPSAAAADARHITVRPASPGTPAAKLGPKGRQHPLGTRQGPVRSNPSDSSESPCAFDLMSALDQRQARPPSADTNDPSCYQVVTMATADCEFMPAGEPTGNCCWGGTAMTDGNVYSSTPWGNSEFPAVPSSYLQYDRRAYSVPGQNQDDSPMPFGPTRLQYSTGCQAFEHSGLQEQADGFESERFHQSSMDSVDDSCFLFDKSAFHTSWAEQWQMPMRPAPISSQSGYGYTAPHMQAQIAPHIGAPASVFNPLSLEEFHASLGVF